MFWRSSRLSNVALLVLAAVGLAIVAFVEGSLHVVKQKHFDEKLAAAVAAKQAQELIKVRTTGQIGGDKISDPNMSGLIGSQFTLITTDQGDLDAKLTSTNPNWAAVVVDMLKKAGVKRGDHVALSYTGSFPGLNIAVVAAIEAVGAKPVIVSSIGSSMWGANNPDFAWLDMEKTLFDAGIVHHKSIATSIGGRNDRGGNLSPEGRDLCKKIAERDSIPLIEGKDLEDAILKRFELFEKALPKGKKYAAYINVGGSLASIGSGHNQKALVPGLNKSLPLFNFPIKGTMILFGEKGVPIIDFTDIIALAGRYGLPISPVPLPEPPSGEVFFKKYYRIEYVAILLVVYIALTLAIFRLDLRSYLRRKRIA
jgi:poly-gamma-glutamate system protein